MTQEFKLDFGELALFGADSEMIVLKSIKYGAEVRGVFIKIFGMDDNVVEIWGGKILQTFDNVVTHQPGEGGRSINWAQRCGIKLEMPFRAGEGGFRSVFGVDLHLVIPLSHV